jgi:hypothetical protein
MKQSRVTLNQMHPSVLEYSFRRLFYNINLQKTFISCTHKARKVRGLCGSRLQLYPRKRIDRISGRFGTPPKTLNLFSDHSLRI